MTADVLREAAALMRERAQVARAGRWLADGAEVLADWQSDPRYIGVCDGSMPEGNQANAAHIASWHPAVALAVADLLADMAAGITSGNDLDWPNSRDIRDALRIARAYLGDPDE